MGRAELDLLEIPAAGQLQVSASPGGEDPKRSRFARVILICAAGFLTVTLIAAGIFFRVYQPWEREQVAGGASTASSPFMELDKFMINLKDNSGKSFILLCDLTIEAAGPGRIPADRKTDLRRVVYRKFKQAGVAQVMVPKFKREFSGELKKELNGMYGENFIINVYFTKFVIL